MEKSKVTGLVTHSYGNHGGAVAYAGKVFKLPTTIVMPEDSP